MVHTSPSASRTAHERPTWRARRSEGSSHCGPGAEPPGWIHRHLHQPIHRHKGEAMNSREMTTETTPNSSATSAEALPDYAPVPRSALGPALNEQGYFVGRVERNLFWVTDGTYQSAFLATPDGVVLFDAPPTIGHNLRRAVDEVAAAEGVGNTVTHLVYSHHHADHAGAANLFGDNVVRIGHAETRRLLLRDNDPPRKSPSRTATSRRSAAHRSSWPTTGPTTRRTTSTSNSRTTTRSCSSTSSTPAGCPSTTSTSARTCPGTSAPRTRPWPIRGSTTSAVISAGSAPATTSSSTSGTSPTSPRARTPPRRSSPSTPASWPPPTSPRSPPAPPSPSSSRSASTSTPAHRSTHD